MKPKYIICIIAAVIIIGVIVACAVVLCSEEPEYPFGRISVSEEMDSVQSDSETMRAYINSPLYELINNCLVQDTKTIPNETLSIILTDFPYYNENDELEVKNITVAELLNSITTKITCTGSGLALDYFTIGIDTKKNGMYRPSDLKNVFHFVQAMAKLNGFKKMIPAVICDVQIKVSL